MEAFIEKFSRKYNLPAADCLRLIGLMERRVFRKGECVVRQGERNSDFYVVSRGIWLGHYLDDGADVSVWFAGEGEALFSTWGYPRLMKKGVDWNECLRYGEGIAAQLIDPKHPRPLTVENLNVRSVKMTIDYNPQTNEYLLEKQRELKAELETLDPDSDRAHRITACYLRDVEDKLAQTRLHYEPECLIVDFGSFRIVTVPCEIDTVLGKRIREYDGKPTLLCAYANGFHYYAVNKQEYGIVFESFNTYFPYGAADVFNHVLVFFIPAGFSGTDNKSAVRYAAVLFL